MDVIRFSTEVTNDVFQVERVRVKICGELKYSQTVVAKRTV